MFRLLLTALTKRRQFVHSFFIGIGSMMAERMTVNPVDLSRMKKVFIYDPYDVEVKDIVSAETFYHFRISRLCHALFMARIV